MSASLYYVLLCYAMMSYVILSHILMRYIMLNYTLRYIIILFLLQLNFRDKPLTVRRGDRLGFFTSDLSKIPVPYLFDISEYALYRSKEEFGEDHVFSLNATIELAPLKWPRSFNPLILFCTSEGMRRSYFI